MWRHCFEISRQRETAYKGTNGPIIMWCLSCWCISHKECNIMSFSGKKYLNPHQMMPHTNKMSFWTVRAPVFYFMGLCYVCVWRTGLHRRIILLICSRDTIQFMYCKCSIMIWIMCKLIYLHIYLDTLSRPCCVPKKECSETWIRCSGYMSQYSRFFR